VDARQRSGAVARLIVVSNRLAIPGEISSSGGLAVSVLAALRADEGRRAQSQKFTRRRASASPPAFCRSSRITHRHHRFTERELRRVLPVARALDQAIAMPLAERRSRQEENFKALRANSIARWYESFIARLAA
jgi:trehalose-6-phosphate synthase